MEPRDTLKKNSSRQHVGVFMQNRHALTWLLGAVLLAGLWFPSPTLFQVQEAQAKKKSHRWWLKQLFDRYPKRRKKATVHFAKKKARYAVRSLLKVMLNDKNRDVRKSAAWALTKIGHTTPHLTSTLRKELQKTLKRKKLATYVLGKLAPQSVSLSRALQANLRTKNGGLYQDTIWALGRIGPLSAPAAPQLIKALRHKKTSVRKTAAWALGRIKPSGLQVIQGLRLAMKDNSSSVRLEAVKAMGGFGDRASMAELDLSRALQDRNRRVRRAALKSIRRLQMYNPITVDNLLRSLKDRDRRVRKKAMLTLNRLGNKVLPSLLRSMRSRSWRTRLQVIGLLHTMKFRDERVMIVWVRSLSDPSRSVRKKAWSILRRLELKRIINVYPKLPSNRTKLAPIFAKATRHRNWEKRKVAIWALGKLGTQVADLAVPAIRKRLRDKKWQVRSAAVWALGRMKTGTSGVCKGLKERLNDDKRKVRNAAVWALGQLGQGASCATPALIKLLKHPNIQMRILATKALGRIGISAANALPALQQALRDSNPIVRKTALRALGGLGATAVPTIRKIMRNAPWKTRKAVILSFNTVQHPHKSVLKVITDGLNDAHWEVRWASAHVLGKLGKRARSALSKLLQAATKDPHEKVRVKVLLSLPSLKPSYGQLRPTLQKLIKDQEVSVRSATLKTIAKMRPTHRALVRLIAQTLKDSSPKIRKLSAWVVGKLAPYHKGAIPYLIQRLKQDQDIDVKCTVLWTFAQFGPKASRALPTMGKTLRHTNAKVRRTTAWAIGNMGKAARKLRGELRELLNDEDPGVRKNVKRTLRILRNL